MDLTFTEEQELLRETVRSLLAKQSSPEIVRELEGDPIGYRPDLWKELARLDLLGLAIPETYGGAGQSALETVIIYEEFGRALCSSPHFVTAVMGAALVQAGGTEKQRKELLPKIAAGDAILSIAWLEQGRGCAADGVQAVALKDGDGYRLRGEKILVPFAGSADRLVVLARTGRRTSDVGLFLVDPTAPGVATAPMRTMGADAASRVTFDGAPAAERIGGGWRTWEEASIDGQIALAAYALGGAERAHEMATAYAKERVQFGKPIGSFQAMAHPLADLATEIAGGKALAYEAAWARAGGRAVGPLAAMAKMYAADVFRRTTKFGQQVLGGIGFTVDIDMQLYFRRAKQLEVTWWDPRSLEERVAAAELDAERPFVSIDAGIDR